MRPNGRSTALRGLRNLRSRGALSLATPFTETTATESGGLGSGLEANRYVPTMNERVPALDGLRGVAILLVLGFHFRSSWLPGGAHGVTLFFVLSGFLITRILVQEVESTGTIGLASFYWRRATRLLPALLVVVATFLLLGGPWAHAWPALAYATNIVASGGELLGGMHHTWSLAVEEHFYLTWPILIAAVPSHWRRRAVGAALVAAVGWRAAILVGGASWDRVFYGTDTVAFALLAGCYLAVTEARFPRRIGGLAVIAMLLVAAATHMHSQQFLWSWFLVVGLAVLAVGGAAENRVLESTPLRWLGRVSYSLYLWNSLMFIWFGLTWFAVAASLVAAWATWHLVEQPSLKLRQARKRRTEPLTPEHVPAPVSP